MPRFLIRLAVSAYQRLCRALWFFTRPHSQGVQAVVRTPGGNVVLVRLSYRAGWHLPGGGVKRGETPEAAMLRELREEIGLASHTSIRQADRFEHVIDFKRDTVRVFLVEGAVYRPARSLEIEAVAAFAADALPEGLGSRARRFVERVGG
ncbi:NUDIX domain-containing protein [Sphingomonas xinjiangensis]|uniref:8-oxo-dGTP pyrophosphatase MutT (NUDIX family) n=1 Tax=Sphingomonas xinjiangensis TaxID=643568 RepID=A0A840YPH5_9SPHN|nr:NUDIX domain-containing protein [Sphingomonas xinjiangensis]MBB5709762.1 8-oxo-dGTP pyrophosphatase MutT (NUDIX family) [Sphingomonas xinjiangensis]